MNRHVENILTKSLKAYNRCRHLFYKYPDFDSNSLQLKKESVKLYNNKRPFGILPKLCYAPWTNMFFNTEGRAIVCCKNTKVVLGKYPENSIHDMWFNPKIEQLRNHINNNDLSFGCYKCKEAILQDNISAVTATCFDRYGLLPPKKYPQVMEFELSNKCNLACVMCSGRVSSCINEQNVADPKIIMPYDVQFLKQLEEFIPHLKEAKFYGGEPFMIDIYQEIWALIIKIKPSVKILVQTNATILNDKIKHMMKKGNFVVSVSLDSVNKENYERIRRNAVFEKTMSNIEWFGAYMKNLGVVAAPFRNNWQDIPELVKFCNNNKYLFYVSIVFHPKELALWSLEKEELLKIINYYNNIVFNTADHISKKNIQVFEEFKKTLLYWYKNKCENEDFNKDYQNYINFQEKEPGNQNEQNLVDEEQINICKEDFYNKLSNEDMPEDVKEKIRNGLQRFIQSIHDKPGPDIIFVEINKYQPAEMYAHIDSLSESEIQKELLALYEKMTNTLR